MEHWDLTEQGKILPHRATGVAVQQQCKLSNAIKHARVLALFPFVASNTALKNSELLF